MEGKYVLEAELFEEPELPDEDADADADADADVHDVALTAVVPLSAERG